MIVQYTIRNFEPGIEIHDRFTHTVNGLNCLLNKYAHYEKKGSIVIEKLPKNQYLAHINLQLPGMHIDSREKSFSPEHALRLAVKQTKLQILKHKPQTKGTVAIAEIYRSDGRV
jgi:ribosome-associated translation inhibitor RaiA